MSEILDGLDQPDSEIVLAMVTSYARACPPHELMDAGEYCAQKFPHLLELAAAKAAAADAVYARWDDRENVMLELHPGLGDRLS